MGSLVRAIALDHDGTLTVTDVPDPEVLVATREVRAQGVTVILVTGRILSELRAEFPGVDAEFDAIEAESGAVMADTRRARDLVEPVDPCPSQAFARRDVIVRQGRVRQRRVLLACDAHAGGIVFDEVDRLGLDDQVSAGIQTFPPRHGNLTLGQDDQRHQVCVPASQSNLLVTGGCCSGEAHLAGLLIEQLASMDYGLLIIDGEGDRAPLADRRGSIAVGGHDPLPSPDRLTALLRHLLSTPDLSVWYLTGADQLLGQPTHRSVTFLREVTEPFEGVPGGETTAFHQAPLGLTGRPPGPATPPEVPQARVAHRRGNGQVAPALPCSITCAAGNPQAGRPYR